MLLMRLSGTEAISVELAASIAPSAVEALLGTVPEPLSVQRDEAGCGSLSVLVLEMRGLGLAWPLPTFDYREVLYRLGVMADGAPAWLALRCDLDRALVRAAAGAMIRYPVRRAAIEIDHSDDQICTFRSVTDGDSLSATLRLEATGAPPAVTLPRRTFVVDRGDIFEVPWDERAAPRRSHARVREAQTSACCAVFGGPVVFDERAVVHRGRTHFCGAARAWMR